MEKMNQVSVTEFMSKSKEEMYDMAVEMVEKYNRLIDICNDSAERMAELMERHSVYTSALNADIVAKEAKIELLEKELDGRKAGYVALKTQMDTKYISIDEHNKIVDQFKEEIKKCKDYDTSLMDSLRINNDDLKERVSNLEKELEQTCTTKELDLKGHQRREVSLVNALADKNDEIKKLKESIEEWKNQERIRTDQLRATERKVEELWKEIEKFTKGEDDDYGKSGFKRYIEHLIEEEERAVPERFKERLNKEITAIFTKEEETEVEVDKSKNYGPIPESARRAAKGRYPWGAKVNDIPCGEDAIE